MSWLQVHPGNLFQLKLMVVTENITFLTFIYIIITFITLYIENSTDPKDINSRICDESLRRPRSAKLCQPAVVPGG